MATNLRLRLAAHGVQRDIELPLPLRVTEPCIGLGGARVAAKQWNMPYRSCNVYDKMRGTRELHEAMVGSEAESYNLGQEGEILDVPLAALDQRTHGLISGPPCPPWSSSVSKRVPEDPRAQVFQQVLAWVHFLAHGGWLLFLIIETVVGIAR